MNERSFRVASSMRKKYREHSFARMNHGHGVGSRLSQSTAIRPIQPALAARRLLSALRERWTGLVQDSSASFERVAR